MQAVRLSTASLLSELPHEGAVRQVLRASDLRLQTFGPKQFIAHDGESTDMCHALLSGLVIRHHVVKDGRRQILGIVLPGEFIDLNLAGLRTVDFNAQAVTASSVATMSQEAIDKIVSDDAEARNALLRQLLIDASVARAWMTNNGQRDALHRVAHLLCELATRCAAVGLGDGTIIPLPLTQEHLADCVGLTPVHLNRSLKKLKDIGLYTGSRRALTLPDLPALKAFVQFRPDYLHSQQAE